MIKVDRVERFSATPWIQYGYCFLFGLLGAMVVFLIAQQLQVKPKTLATVNVTAIIKQYSQTAAKKDVSDLRVTNETRLFGKRLEDTLKEVARDHRLILLPSEAVISGCEDYTKIVLMIMQEKNYA
jgi:hypothetical protein